MNDRAKLALKIFLILVVVVCINKFVFSFTFIRSDLMEPTLKNGSFVFIDKITHKFRPPRRGEIVIYYSDKATSLTAIKRVIGAPLNLITVKEGNIYVDGQLLDEPYAKKNMKWGWENIKVADGRIYALEDNRLNSPQTIPQEQISYRDIIGKIIRLKYPEFKI